MSSHYVIRDYQEPALLILDFDATQYEVISALLEWQPFIIGESCNINAFEAHNIRPDLLFKDSGEEIDDNLIDQYKINEFEGGELLINIIAFLNDKSIPGLNIVCELTDRLKTTIEQNKSDLFFSVYYDNKRFSLIKSGKFKKWAHTLQGFILPENTITTKNLIPLDDSHFQSEKEGIIEVHCDSTFWIGEIIC